MKFIFDFDDVLFHTTRRRNEHLWPFLEKLGIPREKIEEYYTENRKNHFSMKKLLAHFSIENLYEKAMHQYENFVNKNLLQIVKRVGKSNCYLITYGDKEFQLDKIKRTGMADLFREIIVVSRDHKKELIEKICKKHQKEKVIFVDDKIKHFQNLDFKKCPKLKTILYDEQGFEKLLAEISK